LSLGQTSHKGSSNRLLAFYYSFPALLIFCCGNEFFFTLAYLLYWTEGPMVPTPLGDKGFFLVAAYIMFPLCLWKNFMNVVQLLDAVGEIAELPEPKAKAH